MTTPDITIATTHEPLPDADFAQDWWSTDRFRLLPGEHEDHTVFVIDFYDRCKYFGYTKESVFHPRRLAVHPHRQLGPQRLRYGTRRANPIRHPLHQIQA